MDLKNKKQELSQLLTQIGAAGSYDELISLSQRVMALAMHLKLSEQIESEVNTKVKEALALEIAKMTVKMEAPVKEVAPVIAKVEEEVQTFIAPPEVKKEEVFEAKVVAAPVSIPNPTPVRSSSISEKLQTADVSIAARLSKSAIKDLTKAVSINQKILFTKELFKGDSFAFNEAIGKLNAFENRDEAMGFLENDLHPRFSFKSESESYTQFVELIERRYV